MKGKVLKFMNERHYGFLVAIESVGEVYSGSHWFFHEDDLPENTVPPKRGSAVSFEVAEHNGRLKAANVRVVAPPAYVRPEVR